MASRKALGGLQDYTISADALVQAMTTAHDQTNQLMAVQFKAVHDQFRQVHEALKAAKDDLRAEASTTRRDVEANRANIERNRELADERYLGIVKKLWWGIGAAAAIQTILLFWRPWEKM